MSLSFHQILLSFCLIVQKKPPFFDEKGLFLCDIDDLFLLFLILSWRQSEHFFEGASEVWRVVVGT